MVTRLLNDYPNIKFGFLVGIGGGMPHGQEYDIRLGDVVVSQPKGTSSGVVQYDLGKFITGGHFERTGALPKPPSDLLAHVATLKSKHVQYGSQLSARVASML